MVDKSEFLLNFVNIKQHLQWTRKLYSANDLKVQER